MCAFMYLLLMLELKLIVMLVFSTMCIGRQRCQDVAAAAAYCNELNNKNVLRQL